MNPVPPELRLEPTLGEILAAALTGDAERARQEKEQKLAAKAQYLSALRIADELAPIIGTTADQVFNALTYIPDNMLDLLHSPEGWGALAEYAAGTLGAASPNYRPTNH